MRTQTNTHTRYFEGQTVHLMPTMGEARIKLVDFLLALAIAGEAVPACPVTGKADIPEVARRAGVSTSQAAHHRDLVVRWAETLGTAAAA
jgi:hypothetical protein